jgi:ribosomal protein L14
LDDTANSGKPFSLSFFNPQLRSDLEKEAYFICADLEDALTGSVSPLIRHFGQVFSFGKLADDAQVWTPAYAIEKLCLGQFVKQSVADRRLDYNRCMALIQSDQISNPPVLGTAVISFLGIDESLPLSERTELLKRTAAIIGDYEGANRAVIRTALRLFDMSGSKDLSLIDLVEAKLKITSDNSTIIGKALISLWRAHGIKAVKAVIQSNREVINAVIVRAKREDPRLWGDFYRMIEASSLIR